ncbi:MAG: hypothetical protein KJ990_00255 [Proteobacteria bacterium]|nr:hypothetical protein [Pseudomonadota bacterium]MBU1648361.1 hypothetical protein [Pseudomonadota bacterium]
MIPGGYKGSDLPAPVLFMLEKLKNYKIEAKVTTSAGKTLNLIFNGTRCGYINSDVLRRNGVLGYHFRTWGNSPNDACPPNLANNLIQTFCDRHKCVASDLVMHNGKGEKNKDRTFLIIKNPDVAVRVLLQEFGIIQNVF